MSTPDEHSNIACDWCGKSMLYTEKNTAIVGETPCTLCGFCNWVVVNMVGITCYTDVQKVHGWIVNYRTYRGLINWV